MSALTSLLARDQVVAVRKIEEALQKQVVSGGEMSSVLLELDAIPENTLAAYCAALYQLLPATRDEVMKVARDAIRIVPREIAERHRMIPLSIDGRTLLVAMAHPLNAEVEEQLGFLLGFELVTRIVCDVRISAALSHHYGVDPAPRHIRLIERLRQRDPGAIPYVAPPKEGKVERSSLLSQLPIKARSVPPGFLDDEDDDEIAAPAAPVKRPSQLPPEGRTTDPMGIPASQLMKGSPSSSGWAAVRPRAIATPVEEPAAVPARPLPPSKPGSIPPAPVVGVGVRRASTRPPAPPPVAAPASSPPSSLPPAGPPSVPPSETQAALRKLRGPLTASVGVKMLAEAPDRDSILEIFFAFARQFFDYSAIFVVQGEVADGRDAFGSGAAASAVRRISIPLDVPGVLGEVRRSQKVHVGRLASSELDGIVLRDLGRDRDTIAVVLPIAIRGRTVVLFYADRAGDAFELHDVPELVAFVPRVVDAFEKLILRKKRGQSAGDFTPGTTPAAPDRGALKAAAKAMALSVPPRPAAASSASPASPGATSTSTSSAELPGVEPPPPDPGIPPISALPRTAAAPLPQTAPATGESGSVWERAPAAIAESASERRPRRTSSASLEAAGALAADLASAPPPPSAVRAVPAIDVSALARPGRTKTIQAMLGIPRDAPPPPDAKLSLPPASEPPPRPPARAADDDDEPELTFGEASGEEDLSQLDLAQSDEERSGEGGDRDAPGEPSIAPLPLLTKARPAPSVYSLKDAAVDVVGPRARRPQSIPPGRASPPRHDPRLEDAEGADTPVTKEVIHVPAIDARRSAGAPDEDHRRERVGPPGASGEMPSVIVDMGDQVNALVVDLTHCGPDDEGAAVDALLRIGEAALPTLAQAFPGPPWFDRRRPYRRLPRGRDVSAIARALVAFRERAVPYVASLLGAGQADRRFYAALVAGDLVHPGVLGALADRVFDDDDGVRGATLEILPRFRVIAPEWSDALTILRRAAKIRGRDPVRRRRGARALGAMRDPGGLRILVELLDDEDHELAEVAHRSLVEISCEDMGTAARRWMPWLQKNEGRHRVEWLIDALSHSDEAIRTNAGEELKTLTQQYYGYHPASPRKEREVVQQKYRRWWDEEGKRLFASLEA